jgi:hypothetical protein
VRCANELNAAVIANLTTILSYTFINKKKEKSKYQISRVIRKSSNKKKNVIILLSKIRDFHFSVIEIRYNDYLIIS